MLSGIYVLGGIHYRSVYCIIDSKPSAVSASVTSNKSLTASTFEQIWWSEMTSHPLGIYRFYDLEW